MSGAAGEHRTSNAEHRTSKEQSRPRALLSPGRGGARVSLVAGAGGGGVGGKPRQGCPYLRTPCYNPAGDEGGESVPVSGAGYTTPSGARPGGGIGPRAGPGRLKPAGG